MPTRVALEKAGTGAAPPETHTFEGVQITILRRHSATMPDELTVDDVKAMLDEAASRAIWSRSRL